MADNATNTLRADRPMTPFWHAWESPAVWRFRGNLAGMVSLLFLGILVSVALIGPFFMPDPNLADVTKRLLPPGGEHWFGTDHLGRDIMARTFEGARISIVVSVVVTAIALSLGMVIGIASGYFRGIVDEFLSRLFDVIISFPSILLGIIVIIAVGPSLNAVIVALAIGYVPLYGRMFRAGTISARKREFVEAVEAAGLPVWRVAAYHILPNIAVPIIVIATGNMGRMALAEAGLSYLGAGVPLPNASWGNMISEGQRFLQTAPWVATIPGVALTLFTVSLSFVGDALRDAFDLRESGDAGKN